MRLPLTQACRTCRDPFPAHRYTKLYCSNACRQRAYRNKAFTPVPAPVHTSRNEKPPKRKPNRAGGPSRRSARPAAVRRPK